MARPTHQSPARPTLTQEQRAIVEQVVDAGLEFRLRHTLCDPSSTVATFRDVLIEGIEQAITQITKEGA